MIIIIIIIIIGNRRHCYSSVSFFIIISVFRFWRKTHLFFSTVPFCYYYYYGLSFPAEDLTAISLFLFPFITVFGLQWKVLLLFYCFVFTLIIFCYLQFLCRIFLKDKSDFRQIFRIDLLSSEVYTSFSIMWNIYPVWNYQPFCWFFLTSIHLLKNEYRKKLNFSDIECSLPRKIIVQNSKYKN